MLRTFNADLEGYAGQIKKIIESVGWDAFLNNTLLEGSLNEFVINSNGDIKIFLSEISRGIVSGRFEDKRVNERLIGLLQDNLKRYPDTILDPRLKAYSKQVTDVLSILGMQKPLMTGVFVGGKFSSCFFRMAERGVLESLADLGKKIDNYHVAEFIEKAMDFPLVIDHLDQISKIRTGTTNMDDLLAILISRIYKLNIKLTRYLVKHPEVFPRFINDEGFKNDLNWIASQLNRERTWHPKARRIGEDEKTFVFDLLFREGIDYKNASRIFEEFFYNSPEQYAVPLVKIAELLEFLTPEDLRRVIRIITDDPKQSLQELSDRLRKNLEVENEGRNLRNMHLDPDKQEALIDIQKVMDKFNDIVSNMFVLDKQLENVLEIAGKITDKHNMAKFLRLLQSVNAFRQLKNLSKQYEVPLDVIVRLRFDSLGAMDGREKFVVQVLQNITESISNDEWESRYDDMEVLLNEMSLQSREKIKAALKKSLGKKFSLDSKLFGLFSSIESKGEMGVTMQYEHKDIISKEEQGQIPQVFFEPLFKIGLTDEDFERFRTLTRAYGRDKNRSAQIKNKLYEAIMKYAGYQDENKGVLLGNVLRIVLKDLPQGPNESDVDRIEIQIRWYLDILVQVFEFDTLKKDVFGANSSASWEQMHGWASEIREALNKGESPGSGKIKSFEIGMAGVQLEKMWGSFLKFKLNKTDEDLKRDRESLEKFLITSDGKKTDDEGKSVINLIDYYISRPGVPDDLAKVFYDALMHWARGTFDEYKFSSPDYIDLLGKIIRLFSLSLPEAEREGFDEKYKGMEGADLYGKFINDADDQFGPLRDKVKTIKHGWESTILGDRESDNISKFTHDFWEMLNIGNYPGSTACQSVKYSGLLNSGLAGYMANGTVKAVTFIDDHDRIVPARRIVKLLLAEIDGKKQPVIFVEENTQFTSDGIKKLYEIIDELSEKTGLPVVTWNGNRLAESIRDSRGDLKNVVFYDISQGRYHAYSDAGASHSGSRIQGYVKVPQVSSDHALIANDGKSRKGGIDFNPDKMNLQIKNNGFAIKFHVDPAQLTQLQNAIGFTPVVITIEPLKDLHSWLGL